MLADVLAALEAEFEPAVPFKDGPEHLGEGSAPRIIAVPTEEPIVPPEVYWTDPAIARPIAQRNANVDFHVWGKTRAEAETLVARLLTAARKHTAAAHRAGTGRWLMQDAEARKRYGRVYVLPIVFAIPVVETDGPATERTIDAVDTTDQAFTVSIPTEP